MSDETRTAAYIGTKRHISDCDDAILWAKKYARDVLKGAKVKPRRMKIEINKEFNGILFAAENETDEEPTTYCAEVTVEFYAEFE